MPDLLDAAQHALDLVGEDPRSALAEADAVVARIPRPREPDEVRASVTAHRAAALGLREMGSLKESEARLRRGVRLAERHHLADLAAESRMTLAYVLLERGSAHAALVSVDHASGALSGTAAARLRGVRALVLQRSGRTREALDEYDQALAALVREGDSEWVARLRNNRGLLHAYAGDTAAAVADLRSAREIHQSLGRRVQAADTLCNLAWVVGVRGDVPESLALFDLADVECADLAQPERWMDRAEVLLRAGLSREAAADAGRVVTWLDGRGWDGLEAEARLLLAQCLLALDDFPGAHREATRARSLFLRQDKPAWLALSDYVAMTSSLSQPGSRRSSDLDRSVRVASVLRDAGWDAPAADLRITAGRAALVSGDERRARALLGPLAARERVSDLGVRSRSWFARALLQQLDGDDASAERSLKLAWKAVETRRSLLGATDLRAGAATHAVALVACGAGISVASGSARAAFDWAELGRAAVLRYRPALPPRDPQLADALVQLRLAVRADEAARLDGRLDRHARAQRRRAEHEVVHLARRATGHGPALRPARMEAVRSRLDGAALIHFLAVDGQLWAVVVGARPELTRLGPLAPIASALASLTFALRRVLAQFGTSAGLTAAAEAAGAAAARVDAALLAPLGALLRDSPLVVCPTGPLTTVPWSALPSCRGRSVSVAPSAALWLEARSTAGLQREGRPAVVSGPGLPAAEQEVRAIAALWPDCDVVVGERATVTTVLELAATAPVLHLAAHGDLRRDNPLFSSLELSDGHLTGYDLETLPAVPSQVLLPACSSGAGRAEVADETLGLAWTLLGLGATSVAAPLLPVPDVQTRDLMVGVHRRLVAGRPLPEALSAAQAQSAEDPVARAVAAAFVCYGA